MPMTTEQSVIGGRETFGEPKKLAEVTLTRDGEHVKGLVSRLGTTIIEITGRVTGPLDPIEGSRTDFYFKFLPAPDGKGFDSEPALVYCHREETSRSVEAVEEIEQRIGKPVVTSNQSSIWMTLRRLGHTQPVAGFGRLLRSFAASRGLIAPSACHRSSSDSKYRIARNSSTGASFCSVPHLEQKAESVPSGSRQIGHSEALRGVSGSCISIRIGRGRFNRARATWMP